MGRSQARSVYFEQYIRPAPTVTDYMLALTKSPYKTHNRMAVLLMPELDKLIEQNQSSNELETA